MGKHIITRKLEFDAGHRVYMHESKCNHIHGHRYTVELSVYATYDGGLDTLGRVIDFSVLKSVCGGWIDEHLDHGMILCAKDPLCDIWRFFGNEMMQQVMPPNNIADRVFKIGEQKHYIMKANPTAENMAELMFNEFGKMLAEHGIGVDQVKLWETPNCYAIYRND